MKKFSLSILMMLFILSAHLASAQNTNSACDDKNKNDKKEKPEIGKAERLKKMIPDLTEDQLAKIKQISLAHKKSVQETRNLLREKEAHLETLQTKENPSMADINKTIDEIGALRTQMHKSSAQHRQDVRNLLTSAQKLAFDKIKPGEMMREGRKEGTENGKGGRPQKDHPKGGRE